jgi:hypothetical protein
MKELTVFRVLTFVLLPIAVLFGFFDLFVIISSLANPALLLVAFIMAAFVIYTFASLQFLTKGLDTGRPCKHSLRDWIRVNAFVSSFMGIMFLLNSLSVFFYGDIALRKFISDFLAMQPTVPTILTPDLFLKIMKIMAYFMLIVSSVLLVHIRLNFRILKKYSYLFEAATPQ